MTANESHEAASRRACVVCGSKRASRSIFGGLRYRDVDYYRWQCDRCSFIFVDPIPDGASFEAMYSDSYFDDYYGGGEESGYEAAQAAVGAKAGGILDRVKPFMPGGTLLDVGCAGGHFLAEAKRRGYIGTGIEVNPQMAEAARAHGVEVFVGTYESVDLEAAGRRFDVVYMGDALEHLPDPPQALERLKRLLTPDGVFVLNGPLTLNDSLFTMVLRLKLMLGKGQTEWYENGAPYHLSEWTAETMREQVENYGFQVLHFETFEERGRPAHVVQQALHRPLTAAESFGLQLKTMSAWITNTFMRPLHWGDRVILVARPNVKSGGSHG